MKKYIVKRPKNIVEVLILPNKDGSGYQYVNLTKGHICPCKFKTELEALRDMDKKVSEDKILYYEEIKEIKNMTKEELERIKQAYYSGLKVQIWFNGHWENFDARDYSMYSDLFSENRLYRIVGSAYADIAEKRIAELEKQQFSLRNERNTFLAQNEQYEKDLIDFNENLSKAKAIITKLVEGIRIISDPKICLTDVDTFVSEAEQFLKEVSE